MRCGHRGWKGVFWSFCWFHTIYQIFTSCGNTFLERTLRTFPLVGSAVETSHIEEELYIAFALIFQGHTKREILAQSMIHFCMLYSELDKSVQSLPPI